MNHQQSQQDMRSAYASGATGALASGLIWTLAGVVGLLISEKASMLALFFGGMMIFPLSVLLSKLLKRSGKHDPNNDLRHLAFEGLGILFAGLFIAFVVAQYNSLLFFPIMLLIIGARYLTFQSIYGLKIYWLLGGLLMLAGFMLTIFSLSFIAGAFIGGGIEIVFSWLIYVQGRKAD
ncbi:hypothetical protein OS175_09230 [Marinicella sp. S1101]|uniref:DUF7010 family protein n=1 Tax=Marinicella marina TaxID=2996016 RepID=UPI002260ACB9|nr:hypothetical protein [Marinicella marina]MCX7554059.1 hypothetical protein [Marinicella marina]MDJ1140551.1 hypothetical protein [Marinicella marina]